MNDNFAELFKQSLETIDFNVGHVVTGVVSDVDAEEITIHVGLKSEGTVPIEEFRDEGEDKVPQIGDEIQVMLEVVDDGRGNTVLSREKARAQKIWMELCEAYENKTNVKGSITSKVRGGFMVNVGVVNCFLPGSLVDSQPLKDTTHLEGRELDFRVIRVEEQRNNVVLSRRALLDEKLQAERDIAFGTLKEGEVRTGTVKNMTDYGVFVDLGGVDGLLHITDMSWKRLTKPDELLKIGDEVKVKILMCDAESKRISLGMKQLEADPWDSFVERYSVNTRLKATIKQILDYGCFAEVENGIDGLIHISEMSWVDAQGEHPSRTVNIGDVVEVMVLEIDTERHRISLSMKRCKENPWIMFSKKYSKGSVLKGVVKGITDFGLFVDLEGGVTGLVHISDLGSEEGKKDEDTLKSYSKGDKIDVLLLSANAERERVALGIAQADDTIAKFLAAHPMGSDVKGTVDKTNARAIVLKLEFDVKGILSRSAVDEGEIDLRERFQTGDSIQVRVIDVDYKKRHLVCSVKALSEETEKTALEDYRKRQEDTIATSEKAVTKLGDQIMEADQDNATSKEE